jgi:osmoprotectant transport system permease protein
MTAARCPAARRGLALALLAAAAVPACEGGDDGPAVDVGSKSFTESVILGEIAAQLARSTGAPVAHRQGLGGTRLVWQALVNGEIDVYPEYTGTLVEEILAQSPGAGTPLSERLRPLGLGISEPLGFNNTYALAMTEATARRLDIRKISDLRRHPTLRFGFSGEFLNRKDGWPSLRDRYVLPQKEVRGLEHDLAYRGLESGDLDVIDAYTTDAEIRRMGLRLLADDLAHFPRYDAVLVYRLDAERRWPETFRALRRLEGKVDARTMAELNARAKLDRVPETQVAAAFAERLGGAKQQAAAGPLRRIAQHTAQHLRLVGVSLLAALIVALPLGIVAARRPRLGQVVLAVVGVVQTIPSLALLVLLIPIMGIGPLPATVALFFYSLLPVVRNTHAGLVDIAPHVRESAEALGLSPGAILRLVELPIASRAVLAGIKSAAVINVGTATLGALVGAGGLGEPIFTGIRLADTGLILEGAIPASLLAVAVQTLFELADRVIIPAGLRIGRQE